MSRPRIDMRKIREVLRLTFGEGLSRRQVSAASGVPFTTVSDNPGSGSRDVLSAPMKLAVCKAARVHALRQPPGVGAGVGASAGAWASAPWRRRVRPGGPP